MTGQQPQPDYLRQATTVRSCPPFNGTSPSKRTAQGHPSTTKFAADEDGISINQFNSLAVAGKRSALQTHDIIAGRAKGGSWESFLQAMALITKGPILEGDEPHDRNQCGPMLPPATNAPAMR
jgi:hypothetical protein